MGLGYRSMDALLVLGEQSAADLRVGVAGRRGDHRSCRTATRACSSARTPCPPTGPVRWCSSSARCRRTRAWTCCWRPSRRSGRSAPMPGWSSRARLPATRTRPSCGAPPSGSAEWTCAWDTCPWQTSPSSSGPPGSSSRPTGTPTPAEWSSWRGPSAVPSWRPAWGICRRSSTTRRPACWCCRRTPMRWPPALLRLLDDPQEARADGAGRAGTLRPSRPRGPRWPSGPRRCYRRAPGRARGRTGARGRRVVVKVLQSSSTR